MKRITALFIVCIAAISSQASSINGRFRSISLPSGKLTTVFSMEQSSPGFIWMGTDDGLVRYDGYEFRTYRWSMEDSLSLANNIVNALLYDYDEDCLYVGTDAGVSIYDPSTDLFRMMPGTKGKHIKAFLHDKGGIYIGTTTGLLRYDKKHADILIEGHFTNIRKSGDIIWAASYDSIYGICEDSEIRHHDLSSFFNGTNTLVLDICPDSNMEDALWIGSEAGLIHYLPYEGRVDRKYDYNIPIKTFHYNGNHLWAGSDCGLIVIDEENNAEIFQHKVGNISSIPDNVVWCIFEDKSGSIWLGTDHGAAIADIGQDYTFVGLDDITGKTDGLDVGVMETDSKGNLWIGGRNGIICTDICLDNGFWIKADAGPAERRLSHNKVRDMHDDGKTLWIVSDGGLDAYDHHSGKIRRCRITEPTGKYCSNWMYSIAEDSYGRLWIGTYDGGLYGVAKEKILSSKEQEVLCDIHLSVDSDPSLPSNIVRHVAVEGDILYAETYNVINRISLKTWESIRARMSHDVFVVSVLPDKDCLWVGTDKGMFHLDSNGKLEKVPGSDVYVMSLTNHEEHIWIAGKTSISSYCPQTCTWKHMSAFEFPLMSVSSYEDCLYFGTTDGILKYFPDRYAEAPKERKITITELYINEEPSYRTLPDEVSLQPDQNSFSFALSSFTFGKEDETMIYRLKGFDDKWRKLPTGNNKAGFINVPSGRYVFECATSGQTDNPYGPVTSLPVEIASNWYETPAAYVTYILLFLSLCMAGFYYWRMKHMLMMEHKERERAIAMADSKTEFLANISHEFKSPLSIILSFISRMTASEADALKTRELHTIQKNAEKIHLLLNQMVEFNENGSSALFMPTAVSLGTIAKEVWSRFSQSFADKDISARFISDDIGYIFMVDRIMMESAIQNLLSNALKFTPKGGSILMSVTISGETSDMIYVDIKVEDSGCGITEDELPKIFNRRYMAPSGTSMNPEGSGLGLSIVKDIVEAHKGKISVTSEPGKGSCFTIRLSTLKADSFILKTAVESDLSLHSLSKVWQHERKPIILIVEDNSDIRDFIIASLGKDYIFLTACDGQEGLDTLKREKVDLVITDISMPGVDGLSMSRIIRNNLDTAFLPIIILTGKNDVNTQILSFEYADAFITKPFDLNYLNSMIIQLLIKHEQYLSKIRQQKMLAPKTEELVSLDERFLQEMTEIVNRHMDDMDFSVSVLCAESHWSDKQVYRKIKQLTGKTVSEFIRDLRLEKAASYLSQCKLTVTEVMYKVGFTTASYFSKCFKEKFGITPSEYQDKNKIPLRSHS